eukprot:SAG22_NODE_616_length_8539_cov_5.330213_3_plen_149_part_00
MTDIARYHLKMQTDPAFVEHRREYARSYWDRNKDRINAERRAKRLALKNGTWQPPPPRPPPAQSAKSAQLANYYHRKQTDPAFVERRRECALKYWHKHKDRINAERRAKRLLITPAKRGRKPKPPPPPPPPIPDKKETQGNVFLVSFC